MAEQVLAPGTRVRFATPTFVRRGTVLVHRPPSLTLRMDDDGKRRIIPLADWYLEQSPDSREHICVIDDDEVDPPLPDDSLDAAEAWLYVYEAAEMARVEEKQLRRYIRKGTLPAFKNAESRWVINRDRFLAFAQDHGWL